MKKKIIYHAALSILFLASHISWAQNQTLLPQKSESANVEVKPFQKVPDEFFIAEIPNLSKFGPFQTSWGFVRPPQLWLQGTVFQFDHFKFPQWNLEQFPFSLIPSMGFNATLQFFDQNQKPLDQISLQQPQPLIDSKLSYLADQVKDPRGSQSLPAYYQVILDSNPPRLKLHTELIPWLPPKEIFSCEIEIQKEEILEKNKRFKTCLQTLESLPQNAQQQWYVWIQTPNGLEKENAQYAGARIREVGGIFKKSKNFYMSQRGRNRVFKARAGVTNVEKVKAPSFDFSKIQKAEYILPPPSREKIEQTAHSQFFENGEKLEIFSFASDSSEDREKNLGQAPNIQVQFVPSSSTAPHLRSSFFKESRTGLEGHLRPWRVGVFTTYNFMTSNRGEKDQVLNVLGADLGYKLDYKGYDPHLIFETGLWHPTSTLSISEIDLGATKAFFDSLSWLRLGAGYHNYTLSGRNPGSSRLGRMDSISVGLRGQSTEDNLVIRGHFNLLLASPVGFEGRIEYGKLSNGENQGDTSKYLGYFLGYARYTGTVQSKATLVTENFSEDRLSLGIIWGHIGPDSF